VYSLRGKDLPVKILGPVEEGAGGVGILLSLWEQQGILWVETVGEEEWISPLSLKKDLTDLLNFLLS
jgi:hypothetical protein